MALVTAEGIIVLTSTDSNSQPYCEFDSGSPDHQPKQMAWCGNGAVVGYWPKTEGHVLLMIGPKKDWINYAFDSPVYLGRYSSVKGLAVILGLGCTIC